MKHLFYCVATCLVGLSIGLMINIQVVGDTLFTYSGKQSTATIGAQTRSTDAQTFSSVESGLAIPDAPYHQEALLQKSYQVLNALAAQDFEALSKLVHSEKGLRLTPYSTVDPSKDLSVGADELSKASQNQTLYTWGISKSSSAPIHLSITDYFSSYVYNADYLTAPMIGVNTLFSSGNSLENVIDAYPDGEFVEFYFPGIKSQNNGFDWCGLKLVFEWHETDYKLVGLIHSEWTN